jgi:muramoyltetrapeptide carboxypeptidase
MAVNLLKPPALRAGSRLAVIAPASSAKIERVDLGMSAIRSLGYEVVEGRHLRGRSPQYFSGTVAERLEDFHTAFTDSSVDAVVCSRGGYGSNYLLEHIDLSVVRANPKPFFAYSDMTVLQNWLLDRTGLVSFHGPMVAADFYRQDGVDHGSFDSIMSGGTAVFGESEGLRTLRPGKASGVLYGGCLSMLVSALGTPFAADTEGKLLFLEDVSAKPYQIDRMLRQLILAGKLDGVKGIMFGEMLDCVPQGSDAGMLDAMILRVLDWFEGPIAIGLRSGHVSRANVTLVFGIEGELTLNDVPSLRLLEPAVKI